MNNFSIELIFVFIPYFIGTRNEGSEKQYKEGRWGERGGHIRGGMVKISADYELGQYQISMMDLPCQYK